MAKEIVEKIVKLAFEKAKKNVTKQNKTNLSKHIVEVLEENRIFIDKRTISRAYDKYINNKKSESSPLENTINAFCNYLGYKDYADFVNNQDNVKEKQPALNTKQNKITQVEVANTDAIKIELVNHKNTSAIWVTGILIILVTAFIWNITSQNKKQIAPNQITINNFNANKNYYYYTSPKGKIELTENPTEKNAKPLTYTVFNKYLTENNIDTANQKLKLIKAQYFDRAWKDKPLQKKTIQNRKIIVKKEKMLIAQEKEVSLNSKTLFIEVRNKDKTDAAVQKKLTQKFKKEYLIKTVSNSNYKLNAQTKYVFTNSKLTKDRIICTLTLDYSLIDKNNVVIFSDSKQVKGTGFSKETAKKNTINKLKL